jgi:WD40 repeat protein
MADAVLRTLSGHAGAVIACAISADDRLIASGSTDRTARIWDPQSGKELAVLEGHAGTVTDCAFSGDGSFLVTASGDKTLKIWDCSTWTERKTLAGHADGVAACAASRDGSFVVSAGLDGALGIWDVAAGKERAILRGHTKEILDCALSPDGRWIASASPDYTVRLWDSVAGTEVRAFEGTLGSSVFHGCAFNHDGSAIAGASVGEIYVWDIASAKRRLKLAPRVAVLRCAFSPDDTLLVAAGANLGVKYNSLMIWDLATQRQRARLEGGAKGSNPITVNDCAMSANGRFVVSADEGLNTLRIWDVERSLERGMAGGCFVATAACGSEDAADVVVLRRFRDEVLLRGRGGRALVAVYETLSPLLADWMTRSASARRLARRFVIRPAVALARLCLTPSRDRRR